MKSDVNKHAASVEATVELSAMAVVLCKGKILSTIENVYGKERLSLPKGHKEENETTEEAAIRECFEETNIVICHDELVRELKNYFYEFTTPAGKLIRKIIAPFLFEVKNEGEPIVKEERMVAVQWMDVNEFLEKCPYDNVKDTVRELDLV